MRRVSFHLGKVAYAFAQPRGNLGRLQNFQISLNYPEILTGASRWN
jgi:hypothetical protein